MDNTITLSGQTPWQVLSAGFVNPSYLSGNAGSGPDATGPLGFDIAAATSLLIAFEGTYTGQAVLHQQTFDPAGLLGWFSVAGVGVGGGGTADATSSTTGNAYVFPCVGVRHRVQLTALASGTLQARIGITGAATAAVVAAGGSGALPTVVAQGSATASQTGILEMGAVTTAQPTYTTGQSSPLSLDVAGGLRTSLNGATGPVVLGTTSTDTTATSANTSAAISVNAITRLFNGSTFDRLRSIAGSFGAAAGVAAVEEAGATFSYIPTATTTQVKSGAGILHKIIINTLVASATISVIDNTAGSVVNIALVTLPSTITGVDPFTLVYDLAFASGLRIITSAATDITVVYR